MTTCDTDAITERHQWKYCVVALTREVESIHDTVNISSAYRSPVSHEDLVQHHADLDMARYLLAEARWHCEQSP